MSQRLTAVSLLALSLGYGVLAWRIEDDLPTSAGVWGPRTFPLLLAVAGTILSMLLLREGPPESRSDSMQPKWRRVETRRMASLLVLMATYAVGIPWIGLLVSTTLFLSSSFWILGERRPLVIVSVAVGVAAGFQTILSRGLGLYIDDPVLQLLGLQ